MNASQVPMDAIPNTGNTAVLDQIWNLALPQFAQGAREMILPIHVGHTIGKHGIKFIGQKYSDYINAAAVVFYDGAIDAIRMAPPGPPLAPALQAPDVARALSTPAASAGSPNGSSTPGTVGRPSSKLNKVPRPSNAFILYRQHHHPILKAAHPGIHNNEISVILGRQWKTESEDVKEHYRDRARSLKAKHASDHPDYQYQPRKPGQKLRRAARRPADGFGDSSATATPTQASYPVDLSNVIITTGNPGATATAGVSNTYAMGEASISVTAIDDQADPNFPGNMFTTMFGEKDNQWTPISNTAVSAEVPVDENSDEFIKQLLLQFNESVGDDPARGTPIAPLYTRPAEEAQFDEDFVFNLVDWDLIEKEACANEQMLAIEYQKQFAMLENDK